ncbi:MAG: hypothetical protein ACERKN_15050 [Velocimicrobium sp.]
MVINNDDSKENYTKESDIMSANAAIKIDNNFFNDFLKLNKTKINAITPKNPTISKDDEWAKEDCWDNDYKEQDGK